MAENNSPLSIVIDADISKLQKAISDVRESIGQISAAVQKTDLGDFGKGLEQSLLQINQRLDQLEGNLQKTATTAQTFTTGTKDARTALTSLSLVAQDLPFGFIAIQNNLPALSQSFSQLATQTGGNIAAFKALGASLIGPAGLFLAFSVVTAGITVAVQKYGSLSNAVLSIISDNEDLAKSIAKVNKEYDSYANSLDELGISMMKSRASEEGRIETIQWLTEVVTNLLYSESERSNALNKLKEIDKDYYGSFTTSAEDTEKLKEATDRLTESIFKQAKVKGLENRISKITEKIYELEDAELNLSSQLTETNKKLKESLKDAGQAAGPGALTIPVTEIFSSNQITKSLEELNKKLEKERESLGLSKIALRDELDGIESIVKGDGGTAKVKDILKLDTQELDEAFNLKDIKAKLNEYGNILLNVNNTEKQRKDALNELISINPEFANTLSLNKSRLNENKTAIESNIRALNVLIQQREFDKRALEINNQFLKEQEKQRDKNIQAEEKEFDALVNLSMAYDKIGNSTDKVVKANNDFLEQLAFGQEVIEMLNKALNLEDVYAKALKNLVNFGEFQQQEINRIVKDLRFLQEPLEGLFTTALEGGRENWKAFADDIIKQIKRITAALLAKALIKGLANLLSLGSTGLVTAGLSTISDEGIDAWRKLFDPDPARVNFGGLEGGMQMRGQVVFVQRGSDLVGVLNRTNSTIGRIG
jgi:chromosome segregation ATPase